MTSWTRRLDELGTLVRYGKHQCPVPKAEDKSYRATLNSLKGLDKYYFSTERLISHRVYDVAKQRCPYCWIGEEYCICSKIPTLSCKHRIVLFMASKESFRASNSGKLLGMALPGTKLFIAGLRQHEEEFAKFLHENRKNTVVLYPLSGAISIESYLRTHHSAAVPSSSSSSAASSSSSSSSANDASDSPSYLSEVVSPQPNSAEPVDSAEPISSAESSSAGLTQEVPPLNIVVLDGTWTQAKTLSKRLRALDPDAQFVRLFGTFVSLFSPLREQNAPERISTLESTLTALKELGESNELLDPLLEALKMLCVSVCAQTGKALAYRPDDSDDDM